MARQRPRDHGVRHGAAIALLCSLVLYTFQYAGVFDPLDLKLYDFRYFLRGERPASQSIAIVEMDDRTIAAYGTSPLPRRAIALLLSVLGRAGARAVGTDIQFIGTRDPSSDSLLASLAAEDHRQVHAIAFFPADESADHEPEPLALRVLEAQGVVAPDVPASNAGSVVLPYHDLLVSAQALGHLTVEVDPDGVIRRVPLLMRLGERVYPALSLRLAGMALGDPSLPELKPARGGVEVRWPGGHRLFLPTDRDGVTAIDFAGDRAAFRSYSMLEVLQRYRAQDWRWLWRSFQGRAVLIGNTALEQATTDLGATPFAASTPLLFVHANALDSALRGKFLSHPRLPPYLIALGVASVALGCLFVKLSLPGAMAVMAAWLAVGAGVDWLLFSLGGIIMPPTMWMLLPAVVYGAVESYRLVFLERRTREREKELRMARAIQQRLLPEAAPAWKEFDVYGVNIPAREVGGDYYDWLPLGEKSLVVGLGDVSGKGVAAALLMSHLHASFHASIGEEVPLKAAIRAMHLSLHHATDPGRFATFFLALIARAEPSMRFCNAGHNPGVLIHQGCVEMLPATGLPLGAFEGAEYEETEHEFGPGDLLVLYSDGITECPAGTELYGEDRLLRVISSFAQRPAPSAQIGEAILDDVRAFSSGNLDADDVTLVVVRRL